MSKNGKKIRSTLSFDTSAHDDEQPQLIKRKNPNIGFSPVFTKRKKQSSNPPLGQPLDQPLDPKLNLKQLDNDSDRDENITVVPEKEAHSDIQILDHILKNFANLNIHKIINQGDEFTIHYFRLYLYAMKYHQSDIFLQINGISPYIQNFNQLYDQVKRIIIDVSYNWDGSTFKDKFISNSNITPIKLENNEIKGDIIKPVKINPIVLKRLGIE